MIELNSFPSFEAKPDGPQLVLWMGEPFDFFTSFRPTLAEILEALGSETVQSLQVPPMVRGEDFIKGSFRFGAKLIRVYWEHSLSYLSLMSTDMATLQEIADLIRPLVVIAP